MNNRGGHDTPNDRNRFFKPMEEDDGKEKKKKKRKEKKGKTASRLASEGRRAGGLAVPRERSRLYTAS